MRRKTAGNKHLPGALPSRHGNVVFKYKRKQVSVKNSASAYAYIHVNYSLLYVNFMASSKQRAHLRHSVATEKKRLETCIDKYNQLCI